VKFSKECKNRSQDKFNLKYNLKYRLRSSNRFNFKFNSRYKCKYNNKFKFKSNIKSSNSCSKWVSLRDSRLFTNSLRPPQWPLKCWRPLLIPSRVTQELLLNLLYSSNHNNFSLSNQSLRLSCLSSLLLNLRL